MNSDFTYSICPQCEKLCEVDIVDAELEQAACSFCRCLIPMKGAVSELNDQTLRLLIKLSPLPVVVDFYAGWCAPCVEYAPIFSRFASSAYSEYVFGRISCEFNPVMAQALNIKGIPHTLLFSQGQELGRKVGVLSEKQLKKFLEAFQK